jgi:signal transduction histidine kinase
MKPGALILGAVVSVILLAAAGVLYTMANDDGEKDYRGSIAAVQQIQRLSSDWSIEVGRVKSDPLADFDSLAAFLPRMARLKEELSATASRIPDLPDRLANSINAYISAIDAKEERIERFKTGYAVVRNSERYLPLAASNVVRLAEESGDRELARRVSGLIQEMDLYMASPTDTDGDRLTGAIGSLRADSVTYAPALANTLSNLVSHAEVLLAKQAPTEELFQSATSNRISGLTDELVNNLRFELGRAEDRRAFYDRGMLVVIALLALFWIGLALQQRRRAGAEVAPAAQAAAVAPAPPAPRTALAAGNGRTGEEAAPAPAARPSPASAAAPVPAPLEPDLEEATVRGFVVKSAAGTLAAAAEQIDARMDYLRQTRQHLQNALDNSDSLAGLPDGIDLDEEMAALADISASVRQEAVGIAGLAKRLETVAGLPNSEVRRSMTDVNACIEEAIAACGPKAAQVTSKRLGELPEILASKAELRLLLKKIVENSVRAVDGLEGREGVIRIDTARKGDEIVITVIDNGDGIAAEGRMNIFRPFYTSREDAIGIGLTLAGHLVKKYEGVIKINSLPGQGTVAQITLPAGVPNP